MIGQRQFVRVEHVRGEEESLGGKEKPECIGRVTWQLEQCSVENPDTDGLGGEWLDWQQAPLCRDLWQATAEHRFVLGVGLLLENEGLQLRVSDPACRRPPSGGQDVVPVMMTEDNGLDGRTPRLDEGGDALDLGLVHARIDE